MKWFSHSNPELNEKLRQSILALPGVTERPNAGIHEDAFIVGKTMFMHIHGHGRCDIRLSPAAQQQALAAGKAQPHRWAPQQGYVTAVVDDDSSLETAMDLIRLSHQHFSEKAATDSATGMETAQAEDPANHS